MFLLLLDLCSNKYVKQKVLINHISLPSASLDCGPHIWKKASLIVFRQKFYPKISVLGLIFSFTIMNCLKKFIGIKSHNAKQCPARLSPPIVKLNNSHRS